MMDMNIDMNKFLMQIVRLNDTELILVLEKLVEIKTIDEVALNIHDALFDPFNTQEEIDSIIDKIETVRAELLRRM